MPKIIAIFVIVLIFSLSGCASTRALKSARESIAGLERIRTEQESRNIELEELLKSARAGNKELGNLLSGIRKENERNTESERLRIEEKRKFIGSLEFIFSKESEITDKLIEINRLLREYFEAQDVVD